MFGRDAFIPKQRGVTLPVDFGGARYVEYELAGLVVGRRALAGQVADWARTVEAGAWRACKARLRVLRVQRSGADARHPRGRRDARRCYL